MRNTLSDLNNYLFEQMERLNDDELSGEMFEKELQRSASVSKIAESIIKNGQLALNVKKHLDEYGEGNHYVMPDMLESKNKNKEIGE